MLTDALAASRFRRVYWKPCCGFLTQVRSGTCCQLCFDFYLIDAKLENLIGDRAFDNDPLDEALRQGGIEMIAPHPLQREQVAHSRSATANTKSY